MAYVIAYFKDQEVVRRELMGATHVGRSSDCEVSVRDVRLSRRHCVIEPAGEQWVLSDLGSKNGTRVGGEPVRHRILRDDDVIRLGKTTIRFRMGPFVAAPAPKAQGSGSRPADPFEALAGTVADFTMADANVAAGESERKSGFPVPRPSPREPLSYVREDVRGMVSELVSSSWDSIYEHARRPDRLARPSEPVQGILRSRPPQPNPELMAHVGAEPEIKRNASAQAHALPSAVLAPAEGPRSRWQAFLDRLAMFF